jgi:hypothetical protein
MLIVLLRALLYRLPAESTYSKSEITYHVILHYADNMHVVKLMPLPFIQPCYAGSVTQRLSRQRSINN